MNLIERKSLLPNLCFILTLVFIAVFFLLPVRDNLVLLRVRLVEYFAMALFLGALAYICGHDKEACKRNTGFLLSAFIFSITLFWAKFGIDFGDDGLNSTVSWFFVNDGMRGASNRFYIGSTVLNGMWMNLHTPPLL